MPKSQMTATVLAITALSIFSGPVFVGEATAAEATTVEHKSLKLEIPGTWKDTGKSSPMRLATYEIPAAEGRTENAELAIYNFGAGGGSVKDNLARWVGQFESDGRDVTLTQGKANGSDYYIADIVGTYNKPIGPPIRRKTEAAPGYRMLGVIIILDDGSYFLKMTGDDETVKAQADALRASFGGHAEKEEEYSLD